MAVMAIRDVGPEFQLVGRTEDLAALRASLADAAAGRARILLLEGEAGIGKSRLLAGALTVAAQLGHQAFLGSCDEVEQDRPLGALAEAFALDRRGSEPRFAELARLLAVGPVAQQGSVP